MLLFERLAGLLPNRLHAQKAQGKDENLSSHSVLCTFKLDVTQEGKPGGE
jgi:hypothetical protein